MASSPRRARLPLGIWSITMVERGFARRVCAVSLLSICAMALAAKAAPERPAGDSPAAPQPALHPPAVPTSVAGYTFVRSLGGIDEYRLDSNGLSVLLAADHSAPVVTFQVTYRVGSRNEVTGTTGSTHLLEHLMFKGSDAFNDQQGNSIKQYLERVGGMFNASTSEDRTNYYATVGRENLEPYVAIEA